MKINYKKQIKTFKNETVVYITNDNKLYKKKLKNLRKTATINMIIERFKTFKVVNGKNLLRLTAILND